VAKPHSTFDRAGPLIAARLASACITLFIPLVLARVLPQAEYGTYKLLFLVALTSSAVLPMGVAQSLYFFVPRAEAPRVWLGQTFAFMLGMGMLGGVALWAAGPFLARVLSTPGLLDHRGELALYTAFLVAASPLETGITSQGRTRLAGLSYLVFDGLRAAAMVLPVLLGGGRLHALMAAMVAWAAVRLAVAWGFVLSTGRGALGDRALFRRQLAYALPFGVAIAFAIPQQYAHQFIVAHAVGPALFAVYAVACFELPFVELFYTPTSEVLMVQLGELERHGHLEEGVAAFREAVARLALLLLPPIAFVWAVAPAFITTLFGARFADAAPIFRVCLAVMPLGVLPLDATLRARGETGHILRSYLLKAAISIPMAWWLVHRFGLVGAAASYVVAEVSGRAFLGWRVPRALATAGRPVRARELVPWRRLSRAVAVSAALALVGAGVLRLAAALEATGTASPLQRALPLAAAAAVFGVLHLGQLLASGAALPGPLGALVARLRARLGARGSGARAGA
jgi:O-antigen/teichoic acid export membrane protein